MQRVVSSPQNYRKWHTPHFLVGNIHEHRKLPIFMKFFEQLNYIIRAFRIKVFLIMNIQ